MKPIDGLNYILQELKRLDHHATTIKAQKLLFFAHVYSLVKFRDSLVNKSFYAWTKGPVVKVNPDLYGEQPDMEEISTHSKDILDLVIDKIGALSEWSLVEISHGLDCWKDKVTIENGKIVGYSEDAEMSDMAIYKEAIETELLLSLDLCGKEEAEQLRCHA